MQRDFDFGMLMARTFANLRLVWRQVLAYLAVAVAFAFAARLVGGEPSGLVGFGLYFAGQYWLYRALLQANGMLETQRIHFFTFVGLAVVLIFPIMFGLVLLFVPGIFLAARWIAAPAFIVARGEGVFAAAGHSWEAVRGYTGTLIGALVLLFVLVSLIGALTNGNTGTLPNFGAYPETKPIDLIEAQLFPILLFALSCATYELLGPEDNSIEEVFG